MLTWLVIIFALALVFGVIKIENLKDWGDKALKFAQDNMAKMQNKSANKASDAENSDKTDSKE